MRILNKVVGAAVLLGCVGAGEAEVSQTQKGHAFIRENCASCHAVEMTGESPNDKAPPFRTLHLKYPVENLEEALAEGISTGHGDMPEFKLHPAQIGEVIAYLKSLEPAAAR